MVGDNSGIESGWCVAGGRRGGKNAAAGREVAAAGIALFDFCGSCI